MTINRFCSSGLQAISIVADRIGAGAIDVGIAGGVESMSMIPMGGNKVSLNPTLIETMPDAYTPMGITAENVARRFEVSRAGPGRVRAAQRTSARSPPGPRASSTTRSSRSRRASSRTAPGATSPSSATTGRAPTRRWRSWGR